ncbi:MAG: hypothetical protein RLN75_08415 [Longimicrobiales bacterium]
MAIGLLGDTLWTTEFPPGRIRYYSTELEYLGEERAQFRHSDPRLATATATSLMRGGGWLVAPTPSMDVLRSSPAQTFPYLFVLRGAALDTVAMLQPASSLLLLGDRRIAVYQPFQDHPLIRSDPSGNGFAVLLRSERDGLSAGRYVVSRFDADGEESWRAEFGVPPVPLERATIDLAVSRAIELFDLGATNDVRAMVARGLYTPVHLPAVTDLIVSPEGDLFVRGYPDGETVQWSRLSPDGSDSPWIEAPGRYDILGTGNGFVWFLEKDESGLKTQIHLGRSSS